MHDGFVIIMLICCKELPPRLLLLSSPAHGGGTKEKIPLILQSRPYDSVDKELCMYYSVWPPSTMGPATRALFEVDHLTFTCT